jgi:hypothetical protein
MLQRPEWIHFTEQERVNIHYVWDDTRGPKDFTGDAAPVLRAAMQMSLRARLVLCMGLYEWNVWRFDGLDTRVEPLQIAEAGWCAVADPRYLKFYELARHEWLGPIEGPLWCAAMWLQPAMSQGHRFPKEVFNAISFLTRMALHVLPRHEGFQNWLGVILERFIRLFPETPEDPFQDVFDRHVGSRLGPYIGRNALNPVGPFVAEDGVRFLSHTLQQASASGNPFLASRADLRDAGFRGVPYVLEA